MFLKREFLKQTFEPNLGFTPARSQPKLPVVLTQHEVGRLLEQLRGLNYLMAGLLYGSGLRRIELVRLRVKDVDLDYRQIRVMFGKGARGVRSPLSILGSQ